jgi:ring-1,2-phenylacetyl-CoA epoxidase subunit PaaB
MDQKVLFHVYEVFVQKDHSSPHTWVGQVDAGSHENALIMARENFLRRDPAISIWVVLQEHVNRTDYDDQDFFARESDKQYRLLTGYNKSNAEKWRVYKKSLLDFEKDFVKD